MITSASPAQGAILPSASAVGTDPPLLRQAPLLPVAGACTIGIALDRYVELPLVIVLVGVVAAILGAWTTRNTPRAALIMIWLLALWLGAGRHLLHRHRPVDDVVHQVTPAGTLLRLRAIVLDGFITAEQVRDDPLRSRSPDVRARGLVAVTGQWRDGEWRPASGRIRLSVTDRLDHVTVGDEVIFTSIVYAPETPGNPGERDRQQMARDQGLSGSAHLDTAAAVVAERRAQSWRLDPLIARLRAHAGGVFKTYVAPRHVGIAKALLLGDQRALEPETMEAYRRTGVMQVLAISGQHLAILCMAFTFRFFGLLPYPALHLIGLSRRRVIWLMMAFVILYTLITGCQPAILRAAIMVVAWCVAIAFRRRTLLLNSLALAWLVLAMLNPSDLFQIGCILSFFGTLALYNSWRWFDEIAPTDPERLDPLDALIAESWPWWEWLARSLIRETAALFFASFIIWLLAWPIFASQYHVFTPITILLGPTMVFLTAIALFGSFLVLFASLFSSWFAEIVGMLLDVCFDACAWCVGVADALPGGHWYVASVPQWWLLTWCAGVVTLLLSSRSWANRRYWVLGTLAWTCVFLVWPRTGPARGELRCTILDVGHGACAVFELPDGRTMLYDAGSMAGPEVTTQRIAPYLWHRGITRIDEVFLSHADLDHFNGLPALVDRFHVGQVSLTPSFEQKREPAVRVAAESLRNRGIGIRIVHAGKELQAGDVSVRVMHPPASGPEGTENARSLVLLITYQNRTILLTGDLATPGLEQVTAQPLDRQVDVVLAPHHGSNSSNTEAFARWARAGLAVSSEGRERGRRLDPYTPLKTEYWRTPREGAVTIRIVAGQVMAEGFRSGRTWHSP